MKALTLSFFYLFFVLNILAAQSFQLDMNDIRPRELRVAGFELDSPAEIKINASGLYQHDSRNELIAGNCWILQADSRKIVWKLEPVDYDRGRKEIQTQEARGELDKGIYEVYYSSFPYHAIEDFRVFGDFRREHGLIGSFFEWLFGEGDDWRDRNFHRDVYREFELEIRGEGRLLNSEEIFARQDQIRGKSVFFLPGTDDQVYKYQGFILDQPADLKIYALGELVGYEKFDYAWIQDVKNRNRVWSMEYRNSQPAGGAEKNRIVDEAISLPSGTYAAFYVTDDSHSPEEWNAPPAYDPYFWGFTVQNVEPASSIHLYDFEPIETDREIISIVPIQNDEFRSAGFRLEKPANLHIYALGEGRDHEMFDYGWILNATTREKIWEMEYSKTEHAGGSAKNRIADIILRVPAGSYMACYRTDGSHAYNEWNADPPYDRQHYGLTIALASQNFNQNDVVTFADFDEPGVITSIVQVRDDERYQRQFSLDNDGEIRIYALGEGVRGKMVDYGWIEEDGTGKIVWEMKYRMTDYAGGARKNRQFNKKIFLKKGDYRVYYRTDDSHAFGDWNDIPPDDPAHWGITLYSISE